MCFSDFETRRARLRGPAAARGHATLQGFEPGSTWSSLPTASSGTVKWPGLEGAQGCALHQLGQSREGLLRGWASSVSGRGVAAGLPQAEPSRDRDRQTR